jgi:plasmid stabilization system protein ParE
LEIIKPLLWTKRALTDLEKVYNFNSKIFGVKTARNIVFHIINKVEILEKPTFDYSEIGEVDNSFEHLKRNYRKLIEGHCKITYRVGKTKIYINRIFDTRQNPNKNK